MSENLQHGQGEVDRCLRCRAPLPPRYGPQGPVKKWCGNDCRMKAKAEGHPAAGRGRPPFAKEPKR